MAKKDNPKKDLLTHQGLGVSYELDSSPETLARYKAALITPSDEEYSGTLDFLGWCLIAAAEAGVIDLDPEHIRNGMKPAAIRWLAVQVTNRVREAFEITFHLRETVAFEAYKKTLKAINDESSDAEADAYFRSIVLGAVDCHCIQLDRQTVDHMRPASARWLALEISDAYHEAITIPPG